MLDNNELREKETVRTDTSSPCCCSDNSVKNKVSDCCCGETKKSDNASDYILVSDKSISTHIGRVWVVSPHLLWKDRLGTLKARFNIGRMNYKVRPGLYAAGNPDENSPVFVSANYKMSFDSLRKELDGINGWILVLDTKGINVWCAAGKGTFGTAELINRIKATNLTGLVKHRQLIVPQLGAPGIAAHVITKQTGFQIIYGPVRAADLPAFLKAGMKAEPQQRKVRFNLFDRLVLIPVEFSIGFKYTMVVASVFFLLAGLSQTGYSSNVAFAVGSRAVLFYLAALISGTVAVPLLLPYIPGRAFALKGALLGLITAILLVMVVTGKSTLNIKEFIGWFLLITAGTSFLAMKFTGASTYTSRSGVLKETRIAIPLQIISFTGGSILWILARFF